MFSPYCAQHYYYCFFAPLSSGCLGFRSYKSVVIITLVIKQKLPHLTVISEYMGQCYITILVSWLFSFTWQLAVFYQCFHINWTYSLHFFTWNLVVQLELPHSSSLCTCLTLTSHMHEQTFPLRLLFSQRIWCRSLWRGLRIIDKFEWLVTGHNDALTTCF